MRTQWLGLVLFPLLTVSMSARPQLTQGAAQQPVQAGHAHKSAWAVAIEMTLAAGDAPALQAPAAAATNPRFGKWRLKPTDPAAPPSTNVMTYEPFQNTGMKVTINRLEADGSLTAQWGYTTMFDNKETAMTGSRSAETAAVRMIDERTAQITYTNRSTGKIARQLTNVL